MKSEYRALPVVVLVISVFLGSYFGNLIVLPTSITAGVTNTSTVLNTFLSGLPPKYDQVLSSQKINTAINKTGPLTLSESAFLQDKILELESGDTASWETWRAKFWTFPFTHPTSSDRRELWLQQVAMSLFVEANQIVPWSIEDYGQPEVDLILSYFPAANIRSLLYLSNHNPIFLHNHGKQAYDLFYSPSLESPEKLLFSIIKRMRSDGWRHFVNTETYNNPILCGLAPQNYPDQVIQLDFQCLQQIKRGGSLYTPGFIRGILTSYNVPSEIILAPRYKGHGGIIFPSLSLAMDGDEPYSQFAQGNAISNGLLLTPNLIPVENSFVDLNFAKEKIILPPSPSIQSQCQAASAGERQFLLGYFDLFDHPTAYEDLVIAYNYSSFGYQPGEFLRDSIDNNFTPFFCDSSDPLAPNYWSPPLSDDEVDFFLGRIINPSFRFHLSVSTWPTTSTQTITWTSANIPTTNQINIQLKSCNAPSNPVNLAIHKGPNDGSQTITVPNVPSGNYYLELSTAAQNGGVTAATSSVFSIINSILVTPGIKVTRPSNGVIWKGGVPKTVTWISTGLPTSTDLPTNTHPRMTIKLFKADGTLSPVPISPLIQGGNDGNQTFTLPLAPPGSYYIEVDTTNVNSPDIPPAKSGVFNLISPQ